MQCNDVQEIPENIIFLSTLRSMRLTDTTIVRGNGSHTTKGR